MNPRGVDLRLGLLLRQSHQRAARALNSVLAPLGLTGRHFGLMLMLQHNGVSTQRDLIRLTGSDKAGMARTVEDLERLGYLRRTQSSSDKRVADLTLTASGVSVFASAQRLASGAADELFEIFTAAELDTFANLLDRFVGAPDSPRGTGSADRTED